MKKDLLAAMISVLLLAIGCNKDNGKSDNNNHNPISPPQEKPLSASVPINGTWSATATQLTLVSMMSADYCHCTGIPFVTCTFVPWTDTTTSLITYTLAGDSCYSSHVETRFVKDKSGVLIDTIIRQLDYKFKREDTGTGLAGTWKNTALPTVSYLDGTVEADTGYGLDFYRNPNEWSSMTMDITLNTDGSYTGIEKMTLKKSAADYMLTQYVATIQDTVKTFFPSSCLMISAVNDTTLSIKDTALPTPVLATFSGIAPDLTINLSYAKPDTTYRMTSYLQPQNQAACDAEEDRGLFFQLMIDLGQVYPSP